jgi:hypothetical protein
MNGLCYWFSMVLTMSCLLASSGTGKQFWLLSTEGRSARTFGNLVRGQWAFDVGDTISSKRRAQSCEPKFLPFRTTLRRRASERVGVRNVDRLVFARLYHLAPEVLDAVKILKPETIIRASRWVASLLALEIKTARRSTQDT